MAVNEQQYDQTQVCRHVQTFSSIYIETNISDLIDC